MKKLLFIAVLGIAVNTASHAQSMLDKAKTTATTAGFDVNSLTKSITQTLTTKLKLNETQVTKVSGAVSTFLQAKSQIMPLLKTNKAAYQQKQTSLFSNLKSSLATTLAKDQMTKFLGLKPATNDPSNVLSNLFY